MNKINTADKVEGTCDKKPKEIKQTVKFLGFLTYLFKTNNLWLPV